jgi:subtilisin family serine protease
LCRFGPIDLSQDAGCHVRYDAELDLPDPGDLFRVEASDNGADWEILQALTGQQLGTGTPALPDDFVDYSTVYLRFSLEADGDAKVGDGLHVDNVRVRCPSDGYTLLQGTSMATPHVAGAAALLLAQDDSAAVAQLREWLLDGVDLKPAFDGRVASGGA